VFSYGFHKFLGHPAMRNRDFKTCGIIWLMVIENLDVNETLEKARRLLKEDETGKRYVARFPDGVTKAIQYGSGVKSESVYLSMFQLVPLARVQGHFSDQMGLPLSKGSVSNFNEDAYERLDQFEAWAKQQLLI